MINLLIEDYLDDAQLFYDYKTATFDGSNPFDINRGESSFVRQILHDPDYMQDKYNIIGTIKYLTPTQYFEECAKIFNSTFTGQINSIKNDVKTFEKLKQVLYTYKKTFPITYLNYAERGQEGRHRMYLVGELFGWNRQFPVLIIDHADKDRVIKELETKEKIKRDQITFNIEKVLDQIIAFEFYSIDEIIEELRWRLELKYLKEDIQIKFENNYFLIKVKDVEYKKVSVYEFNLEDSEIGYDDLDDVNIDVNDLSWIHN